LTRGTLDVTPPTRQCQRFELPLEDDLQAAQDRLIGFMYRAVDGAAIERLRVLAELSDNSCGEGADRDTMQIRHAFDARRESESERSHCRLRDLLVRTRVDDLVDQHGGPPYHFGKTVSEHAVERDRTLALRPNPQMRLGSVSAAALQGFTITSDTQQLLPADVGFLMTATRFFRVALRKCRHPIATRGATATHNRDLEHNIEPAESALQRPL
jgi:hypothetical protein